MRDARAGQTVSAGPSTSAAWLQVRQSALAAPAPRPATQRARSTTTSGSRRKRAGARRARCGCAESGRRCPACGGTASCELRCGARLVQSRDNFASSLGGEGWLSTAHRFPAGRIRRFLSCSEPARTACGCVLAPPRASPHPSVRLSQDGSSRCRICREGRALSSLDAAESSVP